MGRSRGMAEIGFSPRPRADASAAAVMRPYPHRSRSSCRSRAFRSPPAHPPRVDAESMPAPKPPAGLRAALHTSRYRAPRPAAQCRRPCRSPGVLALLRTLPGEGRRAAEQPPPAAHASAPHTAARRGACGQTSRALSALTPGRPAPRDRHSRPARAGRPPEVTRRVPAQAEWGRSATTSSAAVSSVDGSSSDSVMSLLGMRRNTSGTDSSGSRQWHTKTSMLRFLNSHGSVVDTPTACVTKMPIWLDTVAPKLEKPASSANVVDSSPFCTSLEVRTTAGMKAMDPMAGPMTASPNM
mmetsp:Transcript_32672/g.68306  ORF Transcript_32672/g.68306 Transcript_32672/m.68306 type:complete len:297 (+) Transcript_32672:45-935(+)